MEFLTRLEEIYLLAILRLREEAYGVNIKKKIKEITRKEISYGALYFTLEQLFKKGYVSRMAGEPTPVRGGCSKIYYALTPSGKKALRDIHSLQDKIWSGLKVRSLE